MSEPYLQDFLEDVAFELYVVEKVAPLLVTDSAQESMYDPQADSMNIALSVQSVIGGMTLPEAVEQLGIRPLAFGSAWKMLDLLLEYALTAAGFTPNRGTRWTITEKVTHAHNGDGQAAPLTNHPAIWHGLMAAYAETKQVRHSLVHRRAGIGTDGEVIGVDEAGAPLRPLSKDEQIYFMRAVERAVQYFQQPSLSSRDEAALLGELDQLVGLTGLPATGHQVVSHPPIPVRVSVEEGQELDLTRLKQRIRNMSPTVAEFDVRLEVGGQTHELALENIPDGIVTFSLSDSWLS